MAIKLIILQRLSLKVFFRKRKIINVKDTKKIKPIFKRERKLVNKNIDKEIKVTFVKLIRKSKFALIIKNEDNINIKKDFPVIIKGIKIKNIKKVNKKLSKKVTEKITIKSLKILII